MPRMRRLAALAIFAVAMAFVEAAVVVYLRALYYPQGFAFPSSDMPSRTYLVEAARELATLVMLASVAVMAGRDRWERFLCFAVAFGVWDIFYYAWLWLTIGWPSSLLEWDILFLIPVPWVGPVLAPMVVSVSLVGGSLVLLRLKARGAELAFGRVPWTLAVLGGLIVFGSFLYDWSCTVEKRLPRPYPWGVFLAGEALGLATFARETLRIARAAGRPAV